MQSKIPSIKGARTAVAQAEQIRIRRFRDIDDWVARKYEQIDHGGALAEERTGLHEQVNEATHNAKNRCEAEFWITEEAAPVYILVGHANGWDDTYSILFDRIGS